MPNYEDLKIDSQLNISTDLSEEELQESNLNSGYNPETNLWEVIVKYNGDLSIIADELNVGIEILSSNYAIITLTKEKISSLASYRQIEYIEQPRNLSLNLDTSVINSCISEVYNSPYNLTGKNTVVAIIDSGINYTHKDFINSDGTSRILYLWDQTINGNPPIGFLSGTLYTNQDINEAINSSNPYEIVPERDTLGHGTHVASIAAGNGNASNGRYKGVANESSLIIVKLGNKGQESFARTTEIMRAIKFILDRSIELNMPVAINISFGTNDGSHSGNSLFETYINDMSNIWKCSIVVATGNEGSSSHHYRNIIKNSEEDTIEFSISSDLTSLYSVLWKNFNDTFNFEIISPTGLSTGIITYSTTTAKFNFGFANLYINIGQPTPYNLEQEIFFEIISTSNFLPQGIWRIKVYGINVIDGKFDIWLPVTEFSSNLTRFLQPNTSTTLTIPSTASNVISVGAYNALTNAIADFSGRGFTRNNMIKPDIVAPGVNITASSNTGGYDTLSGTSMAAPFVTGSCALLMEWGIVNGNDPFLYGQRIKAFLQLGANRINTLTYPNEEWGYGSICLKNTLDKLNLFKNVSSLNTPLLNYNQKFEKEISTTEVNLPNQSQTNCPQYEIYSEDYVNFVIEYNPEIEKMLDQYDNINIFKILTGSFAVIYVAKQYQSELFTGPLANLIFQDPYLMGLMNTSALNASGILAIQNQPYLNLRGQGVLIGVVDTGIDYTSDAFIYEDGTSKIVSIWDQSLITGTPPKNTCYGTEFTREQINEALQSENPFRVVPTVDENGHGTNLASIMAGRQNFEQNFIGAAPDAELVVVKLRQAKNLLKENLFNDTSINAYSSIDLMLGIEYLYEKSIELNRPIAICIGLGTNSGGHVGLSILEKYISGIGNKSNVCMCVCTGNEGNARHHTLVELTSNQDQKTIEVRIDEREKAFPIEIWNYTFDRISVNITSPSGETTNKIPVRNNFDQEILLPLSNTRLRVRYITNSLEGSSQLTFIQFENPSPGIWRIDIIGENILFGKVHAWLPISNFISDGTYFLEPNQFYTATMPSTANTVLSVGGYNSTDNSLYINSGRGPTRANLLVPMLLAPSVNVSCIGLNNTLESLTGTSAGTAIVTGAAALMLEWGVVKGNSIPMNTSTILSYLVRGTKRNENQVYPSNVLGFGILDLYGTFENI